MKTKLTDFVARVAKDTIKNSRFEVEFTNPKIASLKNIGELVWRCEACSLPGFQILTKDYKLFSGIPNLKVPSGREQDDIDFTFISSSTMTERKWLDEWIYYISDFGSNNVAYFKNITANITISVYDDSVEGQQKAQTDSSISTALGIMSGSNTPPNIMSFGGKPNLAYQVTLINAYPIRTETVPMSWEDSDKLNKFTATFTYEQLQFTTATGLVHQNKQFGEKEQPK